MTLIELMIGVAILAFLMMSGAPAFSDWIRNTQIRTTAESILNGLQLARTEAARYNTTARFQLTTSLDKQCKLSSTGRNWVVNLDAAVSPEGNCDAAISDTQAPSIRQRANLLASTSPISVEASDGYAGVGFNGLGQRTDADSPATAQVIIKVTMPGQCISPDGTGGSVRCLSVVIRPGGQAQLCDPGVPNDAGASNKLATACPST